MTYRLIVSLCSLGLAHAKMDWIYKELKRERADDNLVQQAVTDFTQIPQYYRFNQHMSLSVNFDEHLSASLFDKM